MQQDKDFKRFLKERDPFLRDLKNFKYAAIKLANTWSETGNIMHDLTSDGSYPFDEEFAEITFRITQWCFDLEEKLLIIEHTQNNTEKGESSE